MINRTTDPITRYLLLSLLSIVFIGTQVGIQQVYAKELHWDEGVYTHYSDQEPLISFLGALAASQKTPIIMSKKIETVVSGFYKRMSPEDIFLKVIKSNGLVWYYDGETLYVEREEEMQTGSVSLTHVSATQFTTSLERLGILDHHYQWVTSDIDKMVYFKGPEPFVTAVLEMSKVLDKKVEAPSRSKIYRWVDKNGVTNYSSEDPNKYNNNKDIREIDRKEHVVLE